MKEKVRIFLIDDDTEVLQTTADILKNYGFEVIGATATFEEAVESLRECFDFGEPFLVLSDMQLDGGHNGLEVFYFLRKYSPFKVPFIIYSGYSQAHLLNKVFEEKITFLGKPFTIKNLIDTINKEFNSVYKNRDFKFSGNSREDRKAKDFNKVYR